MKITGFSTALFSTWYFVDDVGVLFDCGDGVAATLNAKARKISNVFISHADRDHLTGLPQFNQLNARGEAPVYHYPRDCGSFPRMQEFLKLFDPHIPHSEWRPIESGMEFKVQPNWLVQAFRNEHVPAPADRAKSLSYHLIHTKNKLRPEFVGMKGAEIAKIREERGTEAIQYEVREKRLSFSADTPVEWDGRYDDVHTLIHEATFLHKADPDVNQANRHSTLEELMEMIAGTNVQQLILGHFSIRYSPEQIDEAIRKYCKQFKVQIPVWRVLPKEVSWDVLAGAPVNG